MKYLGIDYGSKRVGIAISDEGGIFAFPLSILLNDLSLIVKVVKICIEKKIEVIVIGESLDLSGKSNKIMSEIEKFKIELEEKVKLPIFFQKEFMTTIEARGRSGKEMNNAKKVAKGKQSAVDASAAALILQRFLDRKNKK